MGTIWVDMLKGGRPAVKEFGRMGLPFVVIGEVFGPTDTTTQGEELLDLCERAKAVGLSLLWATSPDYWRGEMELWGNGGTPPALVDCDGCRVIDLFEVACSGGDWRAALVAKLEAMELAGATPSKDLADAGKPRL